MTRLADGVLGRLLLGRAAWEVDGLVWGKDDETLYYVTMDEQHRPFRLFQRKNWKGNNPTDTLLKEDLDDLFWWYVVICMCEYILLIILMNLSLIVPFL